jgi:hypothetical protein
MRRPAVDPLSKRIVISWIATDIIWGALFIWTQRRKADLKLTAG